MIQRKEIKLILDSLDTVQKEIIAMAIKNEEKPYDALEEYLLGYKECSVEGVEFEVVEDAVNDIAERLKGFNREDIDVCLNELK